MNAVIFNVQRFCLHDGPGIRSTVFFKGCPLHCLWCHNPESQSMGRQLMYYESKCTGCGRCLGLCDARERDPERPQYIRIDPAKCTLCGKCVEVCYQNANEICGKSVPVDEVFAEVLKDKLFYGADGGMTLSGGEPSAQPDAALELIRRANVEGFGTVIETAGFGKREFFAEAADLGAIFYYDVKALDSGTHEKLTGVPNERILSNLEYLMSRGAKIVLRLPLIPGDNDSDADLALLARFLKDNEGRYDHAEIMKYHNLGKSKAKALSRAYDAPGYYFARMHQSRSYVIALEHAADVNGMYASADKGGVTFRSAEHLLLLGGAGHRTGKNREGGRYDYLRKRAAAWYPNAKETARWSAEDCMPIDAVPYIGHFSPSEPDWFVATGFGKWGMTSSMVSAEILSDLITGRENENAGVFCPKRFKLSATEDLLKEGGTSVSGLTKAWIIPPGTSAPELARGHGGIVELDGHKVGVFKDEEGTLFAVDARCPHLGCQLTWNPDERSWDCPCHGSRFSYTGKLLDGPAQTDLDPGKAGTFRG